MNFEHTDLANEGDANLIEAEQSPRMHMPIGQEQLGALVTELSAQTGADFTAIPISVVAPGDTLYDLLEAQTKLQQRVGGPREFGSLLTSHGITPSTPLLERAQTIQALAAAQNLPLDHRTPGFVYNLGGQHIVYLAVREDELVPMAQKYAQKENLPNTKLESAAEAAEFLRILSEKYLYHELAHSLYLRFLSSLQRHRWENFVQADALLREKVIEVQREKYPDPATIPVANEAFADICGEILGREKAKNRLGHHPNARELVTSILHEIGLNT